MKTLRVAAGITQADLANRLGVKQSTVSMWESSEAYPRGEVLPKIADLLGCTIDQLFGREAPATE